MTDADRTEIAELAADMVDVPDIDLAGYATEEYVNNAITNIKIPEVDLSSCIKFYNFSSLASPSEADYAKLKEIIETDDVKEAIRNIFKGIITRNAIIIGAGNLATALTGYPGFQIHGLNFVAAFDSDKKKIGTNLHGVPVFSMNTLSEQVKNLEATIAVLTVPSKFAQETADKVVQAGIKAIWNFAPVHLEVPSNILVQNENMATSLAVLSMHLQAQIKK